MKQGSLRVGQDLTLSGVQYRLTRILESDQYQLERANDLALINRTKAELLSALMVGELCFVGVELETESNKPSSCTADISVLSPDKQRDAMRRFSYVKEIELRFGEQPAIDQFEDAISIVAARLDDEQKPAVSTVYRWWKRWRNASCSLISLAEKRRQCGPRRCFRGIVGEEIHKAIQEIYLSPEKNTCQAAYDALCYELSLLNKARARPLRIPSRTTFYRICASYDNYSVMVARKGKRAADRYFRSTGLGANPQHILERVEVDHTPLDAIVVDDVTGKALGRPTVTFIIDRYSRMPLGFEIGFGGTSELAVMAALRHAILPKSLLKNEYPEIENEWPAYGIPSTMVCDNGLEFHAAQLRRMCAELNIALTFCPKKQPHYKGAIERFLGTFNRQISHRLSGTTFSNITERGDYDPVKNARVTLSDVKKLIHLWIADIYNQAINRMTAKSPFELWQRGLALIEPRLPESQAQLSLVLARETTKTLNHEGVQIKGLKYNSDELAVLRIRNNGNAKVTVRIDPNDIGKVWVYDTHDGDYIQVPCVQQEYAENLTAQQHAAIRKQQRMKDTTVHNEESLLRAKAKLTASIKEMGSSEKLRDRKRAAKVGLIKDSSLDQREALLNSLDISKHPKPAITEQIEIPVFKVMYRDGHHDE